MVSYQFIKGEGTKSSRFPDESGTKGYEVVSIGGWGGHPGVDPLLIAVGPDFLLPDGDLLFEGVDQPAAGLERLLAVRATDGDHDADLAQVEVADAVDQRRLDDRPAAAGLRLQ